MLSKLFMLFRVVDTAAADCRRAIPSEISDFEDAVMAETALREEADCIITRNGRDFRDSPVPVLDPEKFMERLDAEEDRRG